MTGDAFPSDRIFTRKKIEALLEQAVGCTLGSVDVNDVFRITLGSDKVTGIAGDVIEQSVLGCLPDSSQRPDLLVDGEPTELKTTGIRRSPGTKGGWVAKEPMSITAVSVDRVVKEEFDDSAFWHKLEHLLLIYYHYSSDRPVRAMEYAEFTIEGYEFHVFSDEDISVLRDDWTRIRDFIRELQRLPCPENEYPRLSHELRSELMFVDTAPKWPNKPRFRLKRQYLDTIVQDYFTGRSGRDRSIPEIRSYSDLDSKCHALTREYRGRSVGSLMYEFGIEVLNKSVCERIVVGMLGGEGKINDIPLFRKIGLNAKTINLSPKGGRTEDMKLFRVDFDEFLDDSMAFEDSRMYEYFMDHQFMCIVFQEVPGQADMRENTFVGFKRLSIPYAFIDGEVRKAWDDARAVILGGELKSTVCRKRDGSITINKSGTVKMGVNLPKSKDHQVFFRGDGQDSRDKIEVCGVEMLRQHVWIKGSTIVRMLEDMDYL